MFSALSSWLGGFAGLRVLDLYAGSGALGLEALSRGAGYCLLVESDSRTARTTKMNAQRVGLPGAVVVNAPVQRVLVAPPKEPYGLALADPPYSLDPDELTAALELLTRGWLTSTAMIVVERGSRGPDVVWPEGMISVQERRYGETMLWYGRCARSDSGAENTATD
jgi:16S rRNA (guanine966-N2)-methyltransferase